MALIPIEIASYFHGPYPNYIPIKYPHHPHDISHWYPLVQWYIPIAIPTTSEAPAWPNQCLGSIFFRKLEEKTATKRKTWKNMGHVSFLFWRTTNPGIYRDTIDQWLLMMIGGGSSYFPIYWGASSAGMTEVVLNTAQVASCPSHKGDNLPRELMITRVMNILLGGMTFQVRSGRGLRTPINLHELGWYNVVESKLTSVLGLTFGIMKIHSASYCSTSWKLLLSLFGFKHAGLQIQTSG